MTGSIEAPFDVVCDLGEGPHWNPRRGRLSLVDIDAGHIHYLDPLCSSHQTTTLVPPVGFAVPVDDHAHTICGGERGLVVIGPSGQVAVTIDVEPPRPGNRVNDGKADPLGRLWFGTMSRHRTQGVAALYRLDRHGIHVVLDGLTLSNGLDWDVERQRMYHIDSTTQRIDCWRFDVETGSIADRTTFAEIPHDQGLPDGLCVDADGCVWVCLFGGGAVRRYDPDGLAVSTIQLPVTCPTSPVFGGAELDVLYVTTSRHRLSPEERVRQPLAGMILAIRAGSPGRNPTAVDIGAVEPYLRRSEAHGLTS